MGVEDRPFTGTWSLNNQEVVKYTPDCLVFLNGDISLPGCPRCNGRINIMQYVTSVSVEAGTDPGAHSANISLTLPKVQGEQLVIDGKMKYLPGLEVHIYMKGYFPLKGQFQHLPDPQIEFPNPNGDTLDLTNYTSYPYYPVFHGVITSSNFGYGDGSYSGSFSCASLLHFWEYQNITSNAAVIAARPNNTPGRTSLFGHNFNNMHPYGIIYTLYKDVAGAAMAVEFALDEQSNLTSATDDGALQLFDQVAIYWENRFKERIQSLRMYGVNGRLFNAAQQAFLSSASNRDLEKLLSNDLYSDPETQRSESDPFSGNYSVAKSLGLANGGLDMTYAPFINQEGDQVNLSVLDMFAFNQDIGQIGSFDAFESTYQTKMEVAQQVTEVTGFEFFQDVDGDLVFKPPFFNLDTSTNRVYRIEDIDIFDYSLAEAEPQATYISVRGSWFKGLTGVVPNTGVTGKRGLYIDYKLVAQFGWRPANIEVAYTTDPRILFFLGVARLDLLNIDVNSATITIPIRPELRPGYPVYIPTLDCYYYVKAFSHSFAFGGECTTSLTLTCRRAKFDAPGEPGRVSPGQNALDLIKLDRPDLPKRKLIVHDNGSPKYVGFPNMVLALDPSKANPQFFPIGVGIDHINSVNDVQNLMSFLREDIANLQPQVLEIVPTIEDGDGNVESSIPNEETRYRLRFGPADEDVIEFDLGDLIEGFTSLDDARKQITSLEGQIGDKQSSREASVQQENVFGAAAKQSNQDLTSSERRNIETQLGDLQSQLQEERARLQRTLDNQSGGDGNKLITLIQALQKYRGSPSRRKIDGLPGSDVTASYFDSLLNLKSQYMASDLPGRYRYYSCSHTNPDFQGQPLILFDDGDKSVAQRTQLSEMDKTNPVSPLLPFTNGLPTDPEDRLRAMLELAGVNWIDTRPISAEEGISIGLFPEGSTKGSQGILGRRGAVVENLDQQTSNNLANILDAANQIISRCISNPAFNGFTVGAGSSWRPDIEDAGSESMHALGRAVDIGLRPSKQDSKSAGRLEQFQNAFEVLKVECMRAYQENLVNFVNVYQDRASSPDVDFIHLDQRTDDDCRLVAAKRGLEYSSENIKDGIVPGKYGYGFQGANSDNKSAERERLASEAGFPGYGLKRKSGRTPQRFPPTGTTPQAPLPAPPNQMASISSQSPLPVPRVEIREVTLDTPRKVIQFLPPSSIDSSIRPPEVEVGVGECSRGMNIAQGPGVPPQILTTDQIQTISFSQFSSTKFVDLVGTSQTTGTLQFNSQSLFVQISDQFNAAAQDVSDFEQTPQQTFKFLYDEIVFSIENIEIPNFENGSRLTPQTIIFPQFEFAVIGPPVTETLRSQFSGPTVPIATTSFKALSSVPSYSSPASKTNSDQGLGDTVSKVASAYANAITKEITAYFDRAKLSASSPAEGKQDRLAEIQEVFSRIAQASTGVQQSPIQSNPQQEKTPLSSKATKSKHAPVFPVSDEKGYEHYGAYRYGRGLSVEPGGTFEFVHQDGDPFQNVSAQTVEEFLRVLSLVKRTGKGNPELEGIRKAEQDAKLKTLQENSVNGAPPPPDVRLQQDILRENIVDVNAVAFEMSQTAQGQEALDELLRSNGDGQVINSQGFDVSDTQFARRFANFSANYAKSSVFKTTVVNAAVQLRDLTAHLDKSSGNNCNCRVAEADILFDGIANIDFLDIDDGLNLMDRYSQRASARKVDNYLVELQRIRGDILEVSPAGNEYVSQYSGNGSLINQGPGTV